MLHDMTVLFWLFVIGAFAGDMVETVFCRMTAGVWMSRSSLVWGQFSIVWGLAIALATVLLYKDREKTERRIFWMGFLLGGIYEYLCSVFTEMVFGKVFWDYSAMPLNLGGRINLLYCFFWGLAAVVWIKRLYPKIVKVIENILKKTGWVLTGVFAVFMVVNMVVSMMALIRYDTRAKGKEAVYGWEQSMDGHFGGCEDEPDLSQCNTALRKPYFLIENTQQTCYTLTGKNTTRKYRQCPSVPP